jgi:tyrosinase
MPNDQTPCEASASWSRYDRVKEILNSASGAVHPSYQGHDRIWNLPYSEFMDVTLYGVRMIAPPSGGLPPSTAATSAVSCCHGTSAPVAPASGAQPGRGAASGLIKGLKGQPPFDGSQFPKLPWGGTPVSLEDIAFIQKWIDDGCPEKDPPPITVLPTQANDRSTLLARASGQIPHPLHRGPVNQFQDDAANVKIRKNIDYLTPEELTRFRNAVAKMKSLDNFEQDERSFGYWARIHANQCQHSWEQFLTWHRAYLYFFEQQLQDIDPTVTLPYWDWASYRDDLEQSISDMGSAAPLDNGIIPEAYRCWIDQAGIDSLKAEGVPQPVLDKLSGVIDEKFNSGNRLFIKADIHWGDDPQSDQAIIAALEKINPLWHYQRWPGGNSSIIFEAYPRPEDVARILQLDSFFDFGSGPQDNHFFGALENVHNLIHNFSGGLNPNFGNSTEPMNINNPAAGDMVNAGRTAFDPIFWGHHSNCDRLWAEWQKLHTKGGPDDPDDVLPPWNMTVEETYTTAKLGYQYMQAVHVFPANNQHPISRFVSVPAEVHPKVVATHRRAEIRLVRVQYTTRPGFFIRVFLNQPDAGAGTPITGNPHYVGMLNMFTGLCIGGPGHCEVPQVKPRRKFDRRSRHHKTPGSFRIDATAAVARLRALGETDFQVTVVVLNIDGSTATDALHMDGVLLNFFD